MTPAQDWICSQCGEWRSDHPSALSSSISPTESGAEEQAREIVDAATMDPAALQRAIAAALRQSAASAREEGRMDGLREAEAIAGAHYDMPGDGWCSACERIADAIAARRGSQADVLEYAAGVAEAMGAPVPPPHPDPAEEIARLTGERDRQYKYNVEQIARQAALEAEIGQLRKALVDARDEIRILIAYLGCKPPGMVLDEAIDKVRHDRFRDASALRVRLDAALAGLSPAQGEGE